MEVYLPALRNVPVMAWYVGQDELVNPGLGEQARLLLNAGGPALRPPALQPGRPHHARQQRRVRARPPSSSASTGSTATRRTSPTSSRRSRTSRRSSAADHAYWLSGLRVREGDEPRARIDARSHAFGVGDPPLLAEEQDAATLDGGSHGPLPFARRTRQWGDAPAEPRANRLDLDVTRRRRRARSTSPARASAATSTCASRATGRCASRSPAATRSSRPPRARRAGRARAGAASASIRRGSSAAAA